MVRRRTLLSLLAAMPVGQFAIAANAIGKEDLSASKQVDVLVLGGGMAGLTSAISAAQNGAKNIMLAEKGAYLGGHTLMSGSGYWIGGTDIQKKAGIEDSVEINWQDSLERGLKMNKFLKRDPAVARLLFEQGPEDLKWLQELGVRFNDTVNQGIGNRKRIHYFYPGNRVGSPGAVKALTEKAKSLGVDIVVNTKLASLVTENDSFGSKVIGAVLQPTHGEPYVVLSKGGVILATGGFANGPEMVERYHPYLKGLKSLGSALNTGEGIKAATDLGANVIVEHYGFGMNMLFVGTKSNKSIGQPLTEVPLIVVNKDGKRFQDETKGYLAVNHAMVEKGFKLADWIFDKETYDQQKDTGLKLLFEQHVVSEYPTLEALAKGEGIDLPNLLETIKTYNEDVAKGKDSLTGKTKLLHALNEGPYYAFECEPRIYTSYSGLEINTKAQVMNTKNEPIPGLYAAGDVTGHPIYQAGLGGGGVSGLVMATVFGRIAGREAAQTATHS